MIRVEQFAGSQEEWNSFAIAQNGYTHFHRCEWRALIENVFGHECLYLCARDSNGALCGILPLVRVRSVVFGHYLVSMPFLNYGGPLGDSSGIHALVNEAVAIAKEGRVKLLELRSRVPLDISLAASHRKITVVLDLPDQADTLFRRFDTKLRSQIRRPQREGVRVEFGPRQVAPFFSVLLGTCAIWERRLSRSHYFARSPSSSRTIAGSPARTSLASRSPVDAVFDSAMNSR